jgi:hypothetical protein
LIANTQKIAPDSSRRTQKKKTHGWSVLICGPLETYVCGVHNASMAPLDHWMEVLRCPFCVLTGVAFLSQGATDDLAIVVDDLSSGFKAV